MSTGQAGPGFGTVTNPGIVSIVFCPSGHGIRARIWLTELQEDETENQGGADGAHTAKEMAEWRSDLVEEDKGRFGEESNGTRLQTRSFADEWRGSVLLDHEVFL